jgi:hypothetical protein
MNTFGFKFLFLTVPILLLEIITFSLKLTTKPLNAILTLWKVNSNMFYVVFRDFNMPVYEWVNGSSKAN